MRFSNTINSSIQTGDIHTITVDIFDTILLRKTWPEGLQFLEAAKRALPLFRRHIAPSITPYEVYTWREYIRQEILAAKEQNSDANNDVDITLHEWFDRLYDALYAKHKGETRKTPTSAINELINIEMSLEKQFTAPNHQLINILRAKKSADPELKVFFLSDMYLTTAQINELLEHHHISDLFDGGTTSTDIGNAKHSGRMFHYVNHDSEHFAAIDLAHNLHIGDSKHADVHMARLIGSQALQYQPVRFRRFRTLAGRAKLKSAKQVARKHEQRHYERTLKEARASKRANARYFHDLGFLFAQPMAAYLLHVGYMAKYVPEKQYLFVSSEAGTFIEAGKHLYGSLYDRPQAAIKLNRKRTINAVAWTVIGRKDRKLMSKLIKTIRYGEVTENRKDIYDFLLTAAYPVNTDELNAMPRHAFYDKLYEDLQSADRRYTAHLEADYNYVKSTLPTDERTVVICDVGWGGTVQAVYTIFAQLHNYGGAVEGLYLGVHPSTRFGIGHLPMTGYLLSNVLSRKQRPYWSAVIWEYVYTNKFQFKGDEARLQSVGEGLRNGYDYFRTTQLNPIEQFEYIAKPRIKRLFRSPTDAEVRALGEIRYDFGFNNPQILRIVDTDQSRPAFYKSLLLHPKPTLRKLILPNAWTGAYIKYYRLYGIAAVYRVLGRLKRTWYL